MTLPAFTNRGHSSSAALRITYRPPALRSTFRCFPPWAMYTCPLSSVSPSLPSDTLISLRESSLSARDCVNPAGICCTITTGVRRLAGSFVTTECKALGPPVELAIATILFPERIEECFLANSTTCLVFLSSSKLNVLSTIGDRP